MSASFRKVTRGSATPGDNAVLATSTPDLHPRSPTSSPQPAETDRDGGSLATGLVVGENFDCLPRPRFPDHEYRQMVIIAGGVERNRLDPLLDAKLLQHFGHRWSPSVYVNSTPFLRHPECAPNFGNVVESLRASQLGRGCEGLPWLGDIACSELTSWTAQKGASRLRRSLGVTMVASEEEIVQDLSARLREWRREQRKVLLVLLRCGGQPMVSSQGQFWQWKSLAPALFPLVECVVARDCYWDSELRRCHLQVPEEERPLLIADVNAASIYRAKGSLAEQLPDWGLCLGGVTISWVLTLLANKPDLSFSLPGDPKTAGLVHQVVAARGGGTTPCILQGRFEKLNRFHRILRGPMRAWITCLLESCELVGEASRSNPDRSATWDRMSVINKHLRTNFSPSGFTEAQIDAVIKLYRTNAGNLMDTEGRLMARSMMRTQVEALASEDGEGERGEEEGKFLFEPEEEEWLWWVCTAVAADRDLHRCTLLGIPPLTKQQKQQMQEFLQRETRALRSPTSLVGSPQRSMNTAA